jgi:hypothetical protein
VQSRAADGAEQREQRGRADGNAVVMEQRQPGVGEALAVPSCALHDGMTRSGSHRSPTRDFTRCLPLLPCSHALPRLRLAASALAIARQNRRSAGRRHGRQRCLAHGLPLGTLANSARSASIRGSSFTCFALLDHRRGMTHNLLRDEARRKLHDYCSSSGADCDGREGGRR